MNQRTPDAQAHAITDHAMDGTANPGEDRTADAETAAEREASTRQRLRAVVAEGSPQPSPRDPSGLAKRLDQLEKRYRWMKLGLVVLVIVVAFMASKSLIPPGVIVEHTMLESRELKLLDNDGTPRLFLRMYSRVPVLQLLDSKGKPRMSLGLRFDDTPFLDLSDKTGKTRATLEMNASDEPSLRLFDKNGETTFKIQ